MDSLVDGASYQVPWYQAIPVEIVNTTIFEDAGLSVDDFPTTFDGIPALCQTIKDETGKLCDIRLTVSDYLAQMTYEGGVEVMSEDRTAFTFDSQEAVDWLQVYVDMVADETRRPRRADHGATTVLRSSCSPPARRRSTRPGRS